MEETGGNFSTVTRGIDQTPPGGQADPDHLQGTPINFFYRKNNERFLHNSPSAITARYKPI